MVEMCREKIPTGGEWGVLIEICQPLVQTLKVFITLELLPKFVMLSKSIFQLVDNPSPFNN